MDIRAAAGELRWGYYLAASLSDVRLAWEKDAREWRVTATVTSSNAPRLSQQPLVFQVPHANGVWRWPVKTLQIADGTLHGVLGLKEKSHAGTISHGEAAR